MRQPLSKGQKAPRIVPRCSSVASASTNDTFPALNRAVWLDLAVLGSVDPSIPRFFAVIRASDPPLRRPYRSTSGFPLCSYSPSPCSKLKLPT